MKRTEDGIPISLTMDRKVVVADVLALLSGVNFSSVEKVIAAIEALYQYSGTDMEALIDFAAVPTQRVILGDDRFAQRETDTLRAAHAIVRGANPDISEFLQLKARFRGA